MRIVAAEVTPGRVPLTAPYRIAGHACDTAELVAVTLRDETGAAGHGAAAPVPHLTGDDFETCAAALREALVPALLSGTADDLDAVMARVAAASPGTRSALAAVDIALHDLHARRRGLTVAEMLGGVRRTLPTSITIGIDEPEVMAEAARRHIARGFRILKVKIGESLEQDRARLWRIREAAGSGVAIRVDANQGYTREDAVALAGELDALGIELFEQPVAAADLEGMRSVGRATRVPVVADEPVKVAADLPPLVAARAARGANIKLMKCGGILEARRIDRSLETAGWPSLVGCMDESRASIAAAAHFAAASATAKWIDLDGHLDLAADPFSGGVEIVDGEIRLTAGPGLGVTWEGFAGR